MMNLDHPFSDPGLASPDAPDFAACGHNPDCGCGAPLDPYPTGDDRTWHCLDCPFTTNDPRGARGHVDGPSTGRGWLGDGKAHTLAGPPIPTDAWGDPLRLCPACGLNAATPGDRYCVDCGSASDRSSWIDGPNGGW